MQTLHFDPESGLPFIDDGTGTARRLGALPAAPGLLASLPRFGDHHPTIPQSEWRPINLLSAFDPPILDQLASGACVGHGGCTGLTLLWLTMGEPLIRFSPCYLYGNINGGRDQGAAVADTIGALQSFGICLESTVPEGMIYRSMFPANADAEAARYKLLDAYQTTDPAEVATAIQMGFAVADSFQVGATFNSIDPAGMVGVDRGPGNHCTCKGGMVRLARGWAYVNQNSWGTGWALGGRFLSTDAHIHAQSYYSAVIYRAVTAGPNAPRRPLVIPQ